MGVENMSRHTIKRNTELRIGLCKAKNHDKVACDDDLSVLKELSVLMDRYRVERNQDITFGAAFHSPLELLSEVERGGPGWILYFWMF